MSRDDHIMNDSNNHTENTTNKRTLELPAVIDGEIVPIEDVEDQLFSNKVIGDGYAIHPKGTMILSPIDGRIEKIASTNHAVYLAAENGMKVLIHIGIDTIELKGEGFSSQLEEGMRIKQGDPLVEIDTQVIIKKGYNPIISVVLLKQNDKNLKVTVYPTKEAVANDTIALTASLDSSL